MKNWSLLVALFIVAVALFVDGFRRVKNYVDGQEARVELVGSVCLMQGYIEGTQDVAGMMEREAAVQTNQPTRDVLLDMAKGLRDAKDRARKERAK